MATNTHTVWYSVPWDLVKDTKPERFECKAIRPASEVSYRDMIARDCAEDYHDNHDGWEASWPLTILLYADEDGPEVARFLVERESRPYFRAYERVTA